MANNHWSLALSLCNLTVPIFLMYIKIWNVNYCYQDINILSYSVVKSITPPLLILKRDSNTDDFLWILHFFKEHLFWRTAANGCFWFFKTATGHRSAAAPVLNLLSNLHWIFLSTVSPPPSILLYITSRFAYMKHLFYWQLILIFLYLTSKSGVQTNYPLAWMFFFRTLTTAFPTSYRMKTVLVEFENSAMMHAHSTSFPVLLS